MNKSCKKFVLLVSSLVIFMTPNNPCFAVDSILEGHTADWSREAMLALGSTRENIYNLSQKDLKELTRKGQLHSFIYPVNVTGLLVPYRPLMKVLGESEYGPIKRIIKAVIGNKVHFTTEKEMYDWLGLNPYPKENAKGVFKLPYPNNIRPKFPMGATYMPTKNGVGLTFSCATCHSASMFGKTVMGLTNKRVRANKFFHLAKKTIPKIPSLLFKRATGANIGETLQFKRTKKNLGAVGATEPLSLGLDTSLAQVALSLVRRNEDQYATKNKTFERYPRYNELSEVASDSKPAVWWNLKYKTRWLSDGSIVAGNPIFTNFLWNEIGRGTDLYELEDWMKKNQRTIDELTVAVFATKAPHWLDFFEESTLDIVSAKRGEKLFNNTCKKCHGQYVKGWSDPSITEFSQKVTTTKINYHEQTPVKDVGTDPLRYQGMKHFSDELNSLAISKMMKTIVEPQEGYVPPPLVGIWMRYPYLHNNSVPNLCALLTPAKQRPKTFYQGPAINPETDFDFNCVGYPIGEKIPKSWKEDAEAFIDTSVAGQRNSGHSKMLFNKDGSQKFSKKDKLDIINFLKTL